MNSKKILAFCLLSICISSCATFSASHPSQMEDPKEALNFNNSKNQKAELKDLIEDYQDSKSPLGYLEIGRYEQILQDVNTSTFNYSQATNSVAKSKNQAIIRVSNIAKNALAIATNDRERDYQIQDYEITFLYAYQALNYLIKNDLENATVSIRNLSYAQYQTYINENTAEKLHQENKKKKNKNFDAQALNTSVSSKIEDAKEFKSTHQIANKATNSYENAFSYYLGSQVYQAYDSNLNNANLSIKNALRIMPNNPYLEQEYNKITKSFNTGVSLYKKNYGQLIVIYEQGFVEPIQEYNLRIPIPNIGLEKISLPYYKKYNLLNPVGVVVTKEEKVIDSGVTSMLVDTTAMAAKSLDNRYPAIMAREASRFIAKAVASYIAVKASGDYKDLTMIGTSLYSELTTKADRRSWLLLPNNIQLYTVDLKKGKYTVNINGNNSEIKIEPYHKTLLWITRTGKKITTLLNNNIN